MDFSPVGDGHDYRFHREGGDPADLDPTDGTFRMIRLKDDIYAVQVKGDSDSEYYIMFYAITGNSFASMKVDSSVDLQGHAQRFGVKLDGADKISGSSSDLLAFVRAHEGLPFFAE